MALSHSFNSRSFLFSIPWTLFYFISLPLSVFGQNSPVNVECPSSLQGSDLANVVQDNFLGISFELSSFDTLWGKSPLLMPNAMQNYLANLRARFTQPLRIRIGGNSMDSSTFVPDQTQMVILTDPNAYYNDVPVNFGPTFFDVLNAMADNVGEMQFMVGLSMRDPEHDDNVITLANAAREMLGHRLDAMLLGNEPDLYAGHGTRQGYTISDYIPEIGQLLHDINSSSTQEVQYANFVGGPSVCCDWNLDDLFSAGLTQYPYKYYTMQHYPTYSCQGPTPQNTNISYFLSHTNVPTFASWQQTGVQLAKKQGVPVLMTEYNTVSCGGSNISDTFAAALWAVDVGLQFASVGISGAYLHTREYQVTYNLFDPPTPQTSTEQGWRTGSPYYSALFLSEAFSPGGSIVVDLNIDNSTTNPSSNVAGYAIFDANGTTLERLALLNYDGSQTQTFNFGVASNITTKAVSVRIMMASSVEERSDISWAGQTVAGNGDLEGQQNTVYVDCRNGTCQVDVPGPGAALVVFGGSSDASGFWEGNSTIAGLGGYKSGTTRVRVSSVDVLWATVLVFALRVFI
ncbi:hypothetical protein BJ138DRAFT_1008658 [Hygrophoropsis aurantiaca]|uniref:Uncharacterized protein n=1 Tax=Hygrophoropsis aurantiaca TaxID=72124 RepID=A0ACB8ACS3_9AGAM|nr:hypothetical protein BJ138DRAFT_1008658 [Hygrophoropsis aurantiaca]